MIKIIVVTVKYLVDIYKIKTVYANKVMRSQL